MYDLTLPLWMLYVSQFKNDFTNSARHASSQAKLNDILDDEGDILNDEGGVVDDTRTATHDGKFVCLP